MKNCSSSSGLRYIVRLPVALCLLLLGTTGATAQAQSTTPVPATVTGNATVRPAGPRPGTSGTNFFNVEGDNNNNNASYGVLQFTVDPHATTGTVTSLTLSLTEANAAFSAAGGLLFYLTRDVDTSIANDGTSPLIYQAGTTGGLGTQLTPRSQIGTGAFTTTGNVNSGQVDQYPLTSLSDDDRSYLTNLYLNGGVLRLIVAPADAATGATYAGATNSTEANRPALALNVAVVPEPSVWAALVLGTIAGVVAKRRRTSVV